MAKKAKKDVEKKLALAARKEAKQEKATRKRLAKEQGIVEAPDDELDQVLQAYKSQDKAIAAAIGEGDKPLLEPIETTFPLPRANATLCDVDGDKRGYFYLFGGEYFDGLSNIFLDDLLRYEPAKKEWRQILTAPRPSPRCAHSCVSYKQCLYVFGGELESGEQYHHYRDLWKFDTNTMKWTEIAAKNPPSARSGHSAFVWKNYMIIFGGFFEALRETKWYNDICVFNLQTEQWMDVPQSRLAVKPEPRSACNIALFGTDKIIVQGGFAKMKSVNSSSETKVHSDAWILHLAPLLQQKPPTWERWISSSKGISNNNPNGRAGTSCASYKSRMLVFGGVVDSEQQNHKVDSVFYNALFALDIQRRKWFPLRVKERASNVGGSRRRRKAKEEEGEHDDVAVQASVQDESSSSNLSEDEEDVGEDEKSGWDLEMLRANMFAFVDGGGNIVYEKIDEEEEAKDMDEVGTDTINTDFPNDEAEEKDEEKEEDEDEEEKEVDREDIIKPKGSRMMHRGHGTKTNKTAMIAGKISSSSVMKLNLETNIPEAVERKDPLPRINASIIVVGHILYLYGGILEVGDREVTLDDMWALDLRKRENWECLWPGTMHKQVWRGAILDDDDSYISTGKDDGSDDDDDDENSISDEDENDESAEVERKVKNSSKKNKKTGIRHDVASLNEDFKLDDENPTPMAGESLADFYTRSSKFWNGQAAAAVTGTDVELSQKELKREGFKLAQTRYDELKAVSDRLGEVSISSRDGDRSDQKKKEKSKKNSKR